MSGAGTFSTRQSPTRNTFEGKGLKVPQKDFEALQPNWLADLAALQAQLFE